MAPIRTVDIAHPPMRSADAERMLDQILREGLNTPGSVVIKIIHGYGGTGTLRQTVRNWIYRNRTRILADIPGEHYALTDADTMRMRVECGQGRDVDLGSGNPGMTILWIK